MLKPVEIEGVLITNPTKVWHELKNSRAHFGKNGKVWLSGGWFQDGNGNAYTMCLANMLRFVTHGNIDEPKEHARSPQDEAEALVTALVEKEEWPDIPEFNDNLPQSSAGFKKIADVLDRAADLVKPYAFTHSVTIAQEVMSAEEKKDMDEAIAEDWWQSFSSKKKRNKLQRQFREWLDSFEERGWATFWKELDECDTPECEKLRKELIKS